MKEARPKRTNIACLHINEVPRVGKFIQTKFNSLPGTEVNGKVRSYRLMGIVSLFGMMKNFWKWRMAVVMQYFIYLFFFRAVF